MSKKSESKSIPLAEFRRRLSISDGALMHLLCSGQVRCEVDAQGMIRVQIEHDSVKKAAKAVLSYCKEPPSEEYRMLVERAGAVLAREIEGVLDRAIAQASAEPPHTK